MENGTEPTDLFLKLNSSLENSTNFTNLTNNPKTVVLPPLEWNLVRTFQSIIFGTIVFTTILGNLLVLWVFLKNKRSLRSPTHYFIANLSLSDLLVGIFTLPFLAVRNITFRWYFGNFFCEAWTVLHFVFCSASILSTLAVCVERFVGVHWPLRHLRVMGRGNILKGVGGVWTLALVLSALPLLIWREEPSENPLDCRVNFRLGHVLIATIGIFHIPAIAMVVLYYLIWRTATTPTKELKGINSSVNRDRKEEYKKQVKLSKKLAFLVGFLIISYTPMFTVYLCLGFDNSFVSLKTFILIAWFRYFNSCLNPFIYAFSIPGFKNGVRNIFPRIFNRRRNSGKDFESKTIESNI